MKVDNDTSKNSKVVKSSHNQMNALMPRKSTQKQDGFILSSLKAMGILPEGTTSTDHSHEARVKQQLAYKENAHLIPEGQDGLITKFLKQRGTLDWRDKYEGWGSWSHSDISMFSATQKTETDGTKVTTFMASDNENGKMEVRQGLQIIDETNIKKSVDNENRVEVLDDQDEKETSSLTKR